VLKLRHTQRGVSLVELSIGLVLFAILLATGMPSFSEWIQNTKVRTAAELVQNGLQTARTEAVKRNANVRFTLSDAAGSVAWSVGCVTVTANCPASIQSQGSGEGGGMARVGIIKTADISGAAALAAGAGLPAGVTFNGAGRVLPANVLAASDITRADITYSGAPAARRLVITISAGGQVRMCDPARSSTDPQGC
jgi:type IV fimbrial biogenesis protein FimT